MTKHLFIVAILVLAGVVVAADDNPLLREEPVEPAWADFDAGTLRIVSSRMWRRIQEIEAENASLRERLASCEKANERLRNGIADMRRPVVIAPPAQATGGGSGGLATSPSVSWRMTPACSPERSREVKVGMSLRTIQGIMGDAGTETNTGLWTWRIMQTESVVSETGQVVKSEKYVGLLRVRVAEGTAVEVGGAK